jgi:hypothetical protein
MDTVVDTEVDTVVDTVVVDTVVVDTVMGKGGGHATSCLARGGGNPCGVA